LGNDYYQRHRSSEALAEWRLALALDPARRDVAEKISRLENSGTAASRSVGNSLNADEDLGRRIALTLNQADKYYQASQLKEADLAYNEILQLDPANGFAQKGLAQLAAETYAADTQRPYDQLTANLYQEGMGFYRKKEWAQSMAKLQEAAKLNPEQPQVKKFLDLSLAEAARQRDMVRERQLVEQAQSAEAAHAWLPAYAAWQEAANLVPPPAEAAAGVQRTGREVKALTAGMLAQAQKKMTAGEYAEALAGYEKVLELFPENADAGSGAKQARLALDNPKQSRGGQAEAQKLYNRGVEAYRQGELAQAVSAWESAAAADPQDAVIRDALARAAKEQGEVREKNHRLAQARYDDGLAAYQRGELDQALAAWKEALELDPEHAKARANLKRVEQEMK
jgi:tetratricopeptide (TPR) repeat protein